MGRAGRVGRLGRVVWLAAAAAIAAGTIAWAANAPLELRVAGRTNATPSIASDGDVVVVVWGATLPSGATDVFAAVSLDGARTLAPPSRVNDVDGDARLSGEQPPRVLIRAAGLTAPAITVVWPTKGANGTKIVAARSVDGGRTFGSTVGVPGADAAGNRGWQNLAGADRPFVVWLDHRELAKEDGEVAASHHDQAAMSSTRLDGVASAQKSKLFVGSLDGAVAPHAVTGGVCYCCKTAIASGPRGAIFLAWRHVYPGNIRDIAFTLSRDGGRTFAAPIRVSDDKWQLEGCPDDGPAMAVDRGGRIHIVWPTLVTERGEQTIALFYASSTAGERFSPRERIPTEGMPHHPQIAIGADGAPILAWDEVERAARHAVVARMSSAEGAHRIVRTIVGDRAVYPAIAAVSDAAVAAWTSSSGGGSAIGVARVR